MQKPGLWPWLMLGVSVVSSTMQFQLMLAVLQHTHVRMTCCPRVLVTRMSNGRAGRWLYSQLAPAGQQAGGHQPRGLPLLVGAPTGSSAASATYRPIEGVY